MGAGQIENQFHERESQVAPPVRSGEAAWTAEHPMDGSWNIICNGWAFATLHYDYRYTCNARVANRPRSHFQSHRSGIMNTRKAPDQSFFLVMRDFGKLGFESVTDPNATRESIVRDIASGQIDRVAYVIECNPVEGWSREITSDIKEAAADQIVRREDRAA
jgi:hypothetical protein